MFDFSGFIPFLLMCMFIVIALVLLGLKLAGLLVVWWPLFVFMIRAAVMLLLIVLPLK